VWDKIDWRYANEYLDLNQFEDALFEESPNLEIFKTSNIHQTINPLSYFHDAIALMCISP
jgi:hypothetical protein